MGSLFGDVVVAQSWQVDPQIHQQLFACRALIWRKSFRQNQHSLELSIISVVRFVVGSLQIQIRASLVYTIIKNPLLSAPKMWVLPALPAKKAVNNINPAQPARYTADLR